LNSLDVEYQLPLVEFMRGVVLNGIPMFDFELQLAQRDEDTGYPPPLFEKINRNHPFGGALLGKYGRLSGAEGQNR